MPSAGCAIARCRCLGTRRPRPSRTGGAVVETADEEIVHGVSDQIADVFDEFETALCIAGHAETGQNLLAKPVGSGDRGGVEVRQRTLQVSQSSGHVCRTPTTKMYEHF